MGKIVGLLLSLVGIWVGLEVYQKGTEHAFGGLLAAEGSASEPQERRSIPQRAGSAVQGAHDAADERRSRLLGE